jgi:hypothetical protein
LRRVVEGIGAQLRDAVALHDYQRAAKLLEEYVRALERVERAAQGTELAEWARLEREAWLRAREEILIPPEVARALAEAEQLARELHSALRTKDYASFCDKVVGYRDLLQQLREHPHTASWASGELEKLHKLEERLLEHYRALAELVGGEVLESVKTPGRFAFELAVSLAPASPEAAASLLDRIDDAKLKGFASGYVKAARELAEERVVRLSDLAPLKPEERLGYMLYAVERGAVVEEVTSKLPKAADRVMEGFWDAVAEIARTGEAPDPEELVAKWNETKEPENVGAALAAAFAKGYDPAAFMEENFRDLARVEGDVDRYVKLKRVKGELEARVNALAERLHGVMEEARELGVWMPEPGESLALRMRREEEARRAVGRLEELMEKADEIAAEADTHIRAAMQYNLHEYADWFTRVRDEARKLVDELRRVLDEQLGGGGLR